MSRVVVKCGGAVAGQAAAAITELDETGHEVCVVHGAGRLLFVSDVPGLILAGAVVPSIRTDEADRLLDGDLLEGGILPKLRAAVTAARVGVHAEIGETAVLA